MNDLPSNCPDSPDNLDALFSMPDDMPDVFNEENDVLEGEIVNNSNDSFLKKNHSPVLCPIKEDKPTTVLNNVKHELFCQLVVEHNGDSRKCLEGAGYKYSASYFSQLKARPEIARRIQEIIMANCKSKGTVALLSERLEMLSEIARDKSESRVTRIKALTELHKQCGDEVTKVDINNNSVVKYVEVELPKKFSPNNSPNNSPTSAQYEITGRELDGLDEFLDAIPMLNDSNDLNDLNDI